MKKKRNLGQEILSGLEEIATWKKGRKKLKTTQRISVGAVDVAPIRHQLKLSQDDFAAFLGVSTATLRNWEQGRREPRGPAKSLLWIAQTAPLVFLQAFHGK